MIHGAKPLIILKTVFLTHSYFYDVIRYIACSRCSKVLVLSFVINLTDLSWILSRKLFAFLEQNIQTKGQLLNYNFTRLLNSNSFLFVKRL